MADGKRFQRDVLVPQAFRSVAPVDITVFGIDLRHKHPECEGFGTLALRTGAASVHVDLRPEKARELAAVLIAMAESCERAEVRNV